jgi:O-antigen biosynthesis protein
MTFNIYSQKRKSLFYIYTGPWRDNAAGVKVMHYLCNSLNEIGHEAYLVMVRYPRRISGVNPELNTPILSQKVANAHFNSRRTPRVIYSETIPGNPLKAKCVVRYFLNYPGALGGARYFPKTEMKLSYTKNISDSLVEPSSILYLPAVDVTELPKKTSSKSNFSLFYAGKYHAFVGDPPLNLNGEVYEVPRINKRSSSRASMLTLLSQAKCLILFENSTLGTEAILMNTPVVFIENPFLGKVIAEQELGTEGTCFGYSENGLKRAIETLPKAQSNYYKAVDDFSDQLREFVSRTNDFFPEDNLGLVGRIKVPGLITSAVFHKIRLFSMVRKNHGFSAALRISWVLSSKNGVPQRHRRIH